MVATTSTTTLRELDSRRSDGIDVALLWNPHSNELRVTVDDSRTGECFDLAVPGELALDAFRHPFAYAALNTYTRPRTRSAGAYV